MKWAAIPCAVLTVLLFSSAARADTCEVKLHKDFVGVWQGPCRNGMPFGKGELTYGGKTYKGVVEDGQEGWVRFSLDDDGSPDTQQLSGRRPVGNESQGQTTGQVSQPGSGGSPLAGGNRGKPAEGAPPPPTAARKKNKFREYNATGSSNAGVTDKGEPTENEDDRALPESAARSPEPPAPANSVTERPARAYPPAVPCKLEVEGKLHDWSGPCTGDGKAYGEGRAIGPNGSTYTGSAQIGKRHGFGTVTTPDGGWYQGGFRDGLAHGEGMFLDKNGEYYRARFENGKQVGEKVPVDYASIGTVEPDKAVRAGSGDEKSEGWEDTARESQRDDWGPDTATAGSDRDGSGEDDPSYVAALGKLVGVLVPGAAADDEYVAAIGTLERREAARRNAARREAARLAAARRAAEREAANVRDRSAGEKSQERVAPRTAAGSNLSYDTGRARRDREERRRRSAERQRKSRALLQRNLKIASLNRQLNREISSCNSQASRELRSNLGECRNLHCAFTPTASCRRTIRNDRVRCANRARRGAARFRSQCQARARSSYRRNINALMTRRY